MEPWKTAKRWTNIVVKCKTNDNALKATWDSEPWKVIITYIDIRYFGTHCLATQSDGSNPTNSSIFGHFHLKALPKPLLSTT